MKGHEYDGRVAGCLVKPRVHSPEAGSGQTESRESNWINNAEN
jgi:hypothetical protein